VGPLNSLLDEFLSDTPSPMVRMYGYGDDMPIWRGLRSSFFLLTLTFLSITKRNKAVNPVQSNARLETFE